MRAKIIRIFFKTLFVIIMFLGLLLLVVYYAFQNYQVQTWLGKKASVYLSAQLKNEIKIDRIEINFIHTLSLKGLLVKDLKADTILSGDINLSIKEFDFKKQKIYLDEIVLKNISSKIIKYKKQNEFNYNFIVNYFSSDTVKNGGKAWDFKPGEIKLDNLHIVYMDENSMNTTSSNMDYSYIDLKHIYGQISDLSFTKDSVFVDVRNLKFNEKCGLQMLQLTSKISLSSKNISCQNLTLRTPETLLKGSIQMAYNGWEDFNSFISKVNFNFNFLDSSKINFKDVSYFTSALNGLNETLKLSGNLKGTVSDLSAKKLKLNYRNYTRFNGDFSITGLPEIEKSYIHLNAKTFSTHFLDLIQIPTYPFNTNNKIHIPEMLAKLGMIKYKGKFDGFVNDFTTYGEIISDLGKLETKLSLQIPEKTDEIKYEGKISMIDFNLGKLFNQNNFNALTMSAEIKGMGSTLEKLNAEMDASFDNISIQNYNYKNIKLNGKFSEKYFNGSLACKDTNANFDFNGTLNFKKEIPELDFISSINRLNLNRLHLSNLPDSGQFSTQILCNIKGAKLDDLIGQIYFDNTIYQTKSKTYKLNTLNFEVEEHKFLKILKLNSSYVNAKINGAFNFSTLANSIQNSLYYYYPSYFQKQKEEKNSLDSIAFQMEIKNFQTIHDLFLPQINISKGSKLQGTFNSKLNVFKLDFLSDKIDLTGIKLDKLNININTSEKNIIAQISSKKVLLSDSVKVENFSSSFSSSDKISNYLINWNNNAIPSNRADFKGSVEFNKSGIVINNDNINFCWRDTVWNLEQPNKIYLSDSLLKFDTLKLAHQNQHLLIKGGLSKSKNDSLEIFTNHINMALFNPLLKELGYKLSGDLNAKLCIKRINEQLSYSGYLNMEKLHVNDNIVGMLNINSAFDPEKMLLQLSGYTSLGLQDELGNQIKNVAFDGNYFLDNRKEAIDIDFTANPANLKLINPLLKDILTIKNAYVNGKIKIHGSPSDLKLDGKLHVFNSEVQVDYTKVVYIMNGDIDILSDQIRFEDLSLREKGTKAAPQGTLNGNIFHNKFSNIRLDFDVNYKKMLVLNTTERDNKTFYGKIYSTGTCGIYGYLNSLHMEVITTLTKNFENKNSQFVLPLDGPTEIEEDDFVHFAKKDTSKIKKTESLTGFNLYLKVSATPETSVQIILDKQNGDQLNVLGIGTIEMDINTLGKFEMFGDYLITSGDYLFTLEHVINKKFDIDAGSSISWSGDPLNAEINVTTSYKQRASVEPLLNDLTGTYKSRIPVDCRLLLKGKLFSPIIKFEIDFPNLDATAKTRINNVLSDENEMNRQVFSFMLFRNFVTPLIFNANGGGVSAGGAAASTSSEMLSNRVSGFLNTYVGNLTGLKDLQLGLNYRPGDQTNKDGVDLALSKQFLNNKLNFDGNFGVNNNKQGGNTSGLIGDVNINYKLTDDGRFRLKGFNRTNNSAQVTTTGGLYTQGIGFFHRTEFESFAEFIKRNKK